ncbi:MAG TPA: hypothetical protein VFF53_03600 [Geobacteraceae bacterium]|nr:hypothetical protein [Geobacteraceae bacterium]
MKNILLFASIALLPLAGCGGGGSTSPQPTNKAVLFGTTDTFGNMTTPIRAIQVNAILPPGVFPNLSGSRTLRIDETGLKGLKGQILFGRYSATTNEVVFAILANPITSSIGLGDFARLTYNVAPTAAAPPESAFQQANYLVSGPNSTDITARITKSVKLTAY